ncbi:MAG: phosphodiesterase [Oscillospiraceae bacterium]|nr:phosphodiesterase [Oscillospiraceae bacterium]
MKLMIASDLHGSKYYVERLMDRYREEAPDRLALLGDILYHGPRNALPREYDTRAVADMLNSLVPAPLCVKGNCDGEVDQMVLHFPVLAETAVLYVDDRTIFLTHGHRREELVPLLSPGDILISGHTHIPGMQKEDGILYVNPGSVSLPKSVDPRSYLILEDGQLLWKGVETGTVWKREDLG